MTPVLLLLACPAGAAGMTTCQGDLNGDTTVDVARNSTRHRVGSSRSLNQTSWPRVSRPVLSTAAGPLTISAS